MTGEQLALQLVDPTEPRILPQDGEVWFAVGRLTDRMHITRHRLALIEPTLRALRHAIDTYLSQGTFSIRSHRSVHLAWLTHAYVDLDTYNSDRWRGVITPDEMVQEILWHCADNDIPYPSIILSSGRGYYAKWFWSQPIPRAEAGRALAVNRALCRSLAPFRADPLSCDLSRILRVAGTINSKSTRPVDIVWLNGPSGAPTTYDFDAFARELPRLAIDELQAGDGPPRGYNPRLGLEESRRLLPNEWRRYTFSREHWHWGVLEDTRALAALRYPDGIVQPGKRDLFGHVAACQLARVIKPGPLFHEIVATARTFLPEGYVLSDEFRRHCSTLLERATRAAEGELVTFRNHLRTPIYTYSKQKLIDTLQVTPDEERSMTRLISDTEKRRRETERRRAAGMMERAEYEGRSAERGAQAAAMRAQGMTLRAIGTKLGISHERVRQLLAVAGTP